MGKTVDLDEKGEDSSNYQRLVEDDDVIKMLEIILKKRDEDLQVQDDLNHSEDSMLDRKINHLKKYARNKGYSINDIVKLLKDE